MVFHGWLRPYWRTAFTASHLSYTCRFKTQCQAIVKVHRVFPSFCGYTAFSPRLQFHRVSWPRQRGDRYAIRAGRNLPDKEFRYLRTVIVTAAVYRGFKSELRLRLTPPFNLPAPGRRQSVYVVCRTSHRPMFLVNSRHHHFSAAPRG